MDEDAKGLTFHEDTSSNNKILKIVELTRQKLTTIFTVLVNVQ
jgi:hypothetical protein